MKKYFLFTAVVFSGSGIAQPPTTTTTTSPPPTTTTTTAPQSPTSPTVYGPTVNNGVYTPEHLPNRKPIPYTPLREADVIWSRRIWRSIDVREKINHPLYYPTSEIAKRPSLFTIIRNGIMANQLTAYNAVHAVFDPDEEFREELLPAAAAKTLFIEKPILKEDTITGEMISVTVPDTIKPDAIAQYWLKEDWFFDKQRSVMDVRILGIAPVVENQDLTTGEFKGYKALFWLYYPACRSYFGKYQCFNPYNDAEWRTYDEVFHKRLFTSYVTQESNVYNRTVMGYNQGIDNLMESDRIKDDMFKFEHDMWHY